MWRGGAGEAWASKGESSPGRRLLLGAGLVSAAAAFAACLVAVREPDVFHHLAMGRDILRHGLRAEEPFLYPFAGRTTGPVPYWLGSVAIYAWEALTGEGGLALLPAMAAALVCVLLVLDSFQGRDELSPRSIAAAALPIALAVGALRFRVQARPEIFGMICFAAVPWALGRFEARRRAPILAMPVLFLVWSNLHPSVAAGLGVMAISVAGGAAQLAVRRATGRALPGTLETRALLGLGGATALCAIATFVSPGGSPLRPAFDFASAVFGPMSAASAPGSHDVGLVVRWMVSEMRPADSRFWGEPAGLLLVVTAVALAFAWRSVRLREVATLVAFALLAVRATRFAAFAAIVAAPIAARSIDRLLLRLRDPRVARWAAGALAALAVPVTVASAMLHPARPPAGWGVVREFPRRGVDYLASIGFSGRIFNTFQFGGYLEWKGVALAYQDGRGVLHPGEVEAAVAGPSARDAFEGLDGKYRFDALLLAYPADAGKGGAGVAALKGSRDWLVDRQEWSLVAFDDGGLLYLRRTGRYAAQAARDEYRLIAPATSFVTWQPAELPRMLEEYRRSLAETPGCARCRQQFGTLAVAAGRPRDAAIAVSPVLETDGRPNVGALLVGAAAAAGLGDRSTAVALYERAEAAGEKDVAPSMLARFAYEAGDLARAERALAPKLAVELPGRADVELGLAIAGARGDLARAATLRGGLERIANAEAAAVFFYQGLSAFGAKRYAEAASLFEASIARDASSAPAHSNLGFAYEEMGRLDDAVAAQRRAIAVDPQYANAHYGLAALLAKRNDRSGAIASFRRYLDLQPSGFWSARAAQAIEQLEAR